MPLSRAGLVLGSALLMAFQLGACAPKTGLELEVRGPKNPTSVMAGIVELELVVGHESYCERWVADETATGRRFDVAKRDLARSPLHVLVLPVTATDLAANVRPLLLARDASGHVVGVASFGAHAFRFEKVDRYVAEVQLFDEGRVDEGPSYATSDGCVCIPGQPSIGTGAQSGCDLALPPSFARLVDTAGCELPAGAALPAVCDGQLYPGEQENRDLPCFRTSATACVLGQRTCVDTSGRAWGSECPADSALTLPSGALCDAFLACQQTACVDPVECLKRTTMHKLLQCTLHVAVNGGTVSVCPAASTQVALGSATGAQCTASMVDGKTVGGATIGWVVDGQAAAQVTSAHCPPTLRFDTLAGKPGDLAPATFPVTIGDQLYDVELTYAVGCGQGNGANDLHCVGL